MESTKTNILSPKEVSNTEVPRGGHRIYIDEDLQWVVKPMDLATYKKIKQMIRVGKETEAAIWALNRLMIAGTVSPMECENNLELVITIENAIADIIEPMSLQVKKK